MNFDLSAVSPVIEMGAYEELWARESQTQKTLSLQFSELLTAPSDLVDAAASQARYQQVRDLLLNAQVKNVGFSVQGTFGFPETIMQAANPLPCFYYRGDLGLLGTGRRVAVVGARSATADAILRTAKLTRLLVESGAIIVSGLAQGIDTAAHEAAIASRGQTVAVIGTPIHQYYPAQNLRLQQQIADEYLLVSQVPIIRYSNEAFSQHRFWFPVRNVLMSALSEATIIVEASETSGSLIQARAALAQGRKLFILNSCFESGLSWPAKYEAKGAIRVRKFDEIARELAL